MPHANIWIRREDWAKWESLEKKAEFMHNALNGIVLPEQSKAYKKMSPDEVTINTTPNFVPKPPDPETGYPCCTRPKPCKHWQWDDVETVWRNELTGKTREV